MGLPGQFSVTFNSLEYIDLVLAPSAGTVIFGDIPAVRIEIENASPDLIVSNLDVLEVQAMDGEIINLSLDVSNIGNAKADNATVGIYLSTDGTITDQDQLLTTLNVGPTLAQKSSMTLAASSLIPDGLSQGNYFIGAIADPLNVIAEINESNNLSNADGAVYLHEITDGFQAKRIINNWIAFYNNEAPHTALDKRTPDAAYFTQAEIRKAA